MRNDGAYNVFDSEVHHECMSLGMVILIFIEQKSNLVISTEKFDSTKVVMHNLVEIDEWVKPEKRKPFARCDNSYDLVGISQRQIYNEVLDLTITTDNLTRMAQLHISH